MNQDVKLDWPSLVEPNSKPSEPAPTPGGAAHDDSTAAFMPGATAKTNVAAASGRRNFGRYEVRGILGKGGMGEVFLAYDTVLQRSVALKAPRLADNSPTVRERLKREAIAAAALLHPNICPLHDVGEVDGQVFLTMAYIDGAPLSAVIRKNGPMDVDRTVQLIGKVASAMQHAHERGFLHRDLKPGNILITKQGEPAVTDFGLAFDFNAETDQRLTETGLVVGTPAYMPPEQINSQPLTPAADVYSLGVVFYELLKGQPPFSGPLGKLISQIESAEPPPLRKSRPDLDPALETLCLKALAKQPEDRYPDMASMAAALANYAEAKRARQLAQAASQAMRRRIAVLVAASVLAIAGTVTAAVLWVRQADREIAPVPELAKTDVDRLFEALVKPLVKIDMAVSPEMPMQIGRQTIPPSVLQFPGVDGQVRVHDGPLYFSISGTGAGHTLDLADQPGQAGQITHFGGEFHVKGPYLLFLGSLVETSRIHISPGPGYTILAPMNGGQGCRHIEFDGTHFLEPKITAPQIDIADATDEERAALRNRDLIKRFVWDYGATKYTIFARPGTQVVPGNHEVRKVQFPEVYEIIELDRRRQMNAPPPVGNARLQQALRDAGRN